MACCSQTQHDPETARRARLAALERAAGGESGAQGARGGGAGGVREEAAAPLLAASDHDVLTLQVRRVSRWSTAHTLRLLCVLTYGMCR